MDCWWLYIAIQVVGMREERGERREERGERAR